MEKEAEFLTPPNCWKYVAAFDRLDAETGMRSWGFDFAKEASVKKYALTVKLHKESRPVERLLAAKRHLEDIVGEKLPEDPNELKTVLETLPLDLKKLIERHVP